MTRTHAAATSGKHDKWSRWLKGIAADLYTVDAARMVWRAVRDAAVQGAVPPTHFFHLYDHAYLVSQSVAVRRQAEVDPRVSSLGAVLKELIDNPSELSREWFVARYDEPIIAQLQWAQVATPDGSQIDVAAIRADLDRLASAAATTKAYVDRHLAHLDTKRRPTDLPPTHQELDTAIDETLRVFREYNALITSVDLDPVGPVFLYDVMAPFRQAWLPPL